MTRAQFYAEDGLVWYAQAYAVGSWHALLLPRDGYFQTLPRLAAALALLWPLRWAPLVMNAVGLLLQALPVPLLLSSRLSAWAGFPTRIAMALTYLALPNAAELQASITEGQWHLALVACLLILAAPLSIRLGRAADLAALLLCGLSGPFVLPLAIVTAALYFVQRDRWHRLLAAIVSGCAALQLAGLLFSQSRPASILGATPKLFLQIISAQIYAGSLVGRNAFHRSSLFVLLLVAAIGTAIVLYCAVKASLQWRLFLFFCASVFAAGLANPNAGRGPSQWTVMAGVWDNRYWFFGLIGFVWSVSWCATSAPHTPFRIVGGLAILLMLIYVPKNWILPPQTDVHFAEAARSFELAPRGETVTIPHPARRLDAAPN